MPENKQNLNGKSLIISRTDSIGDVVLTLPMAGLIKKYYPDCYIIFLGRNYTKEVVVMSMYVDEFVSWDNKEAVSKLTADIILHVFPVKEIAVWAKKINIKLRIGTTNRIFHWLTCNLLIRLSRKNSSLHEAQLNIKLLGFTGIRTEVSLSELSDYYGFTNVQTLSQKWIQLIDEHKINLILHPKSKGSAREWGLENFSHLVTLLPKERFNIFISGTKEEGLALTTLLNDHPEVIDITGKMNLSEFISFINACDALVAASTGPLHIASALGKHAIGLFAPMKPIHPGRWKPIGKNAEFLVLNKNCSDCRKTMDCHCIKELTPKQVVYLLNNSQHNRLRK